MNCSDYAAIVITVTLLVAALVFTPINLVYGLLAFFIGISFGLNYLAWKNRFWKKRDENAKPD
jgi:hypothetical protein